MNALLFGSLIILAGFGMYFATGRIRANHSAEVELEAVEP
jgi:hypothetical protein